MCPIVQQYDGNSVHLLIFQLIRKQLCSRDCRELLQLVERLVEGPNFCCTIKQGLFVLALWIIKFIYSEKATKFCEVFTLLLSYVVPVKSKVKISQTFVAFSDIWTLLLIPQIFRPTAIPWDFKRFSGSLLKKGFRTTPTLHKACEQLTIN